MFFLGAIQAFCSLTSGFLVLKYKEENLVKFTTLLTGFFFLLYIFEPSDKINVEVWVSIIFTLLVIFGNIGIELNWTIFVNLLQKLIPLEYQQNLFAFADMLNMVLSLLLPSYIEFMVSISISPIFGFGILAILARLCVSLLKVDGNNKEKKAQEINVEVEIRNENNYNLLEK